MIATAGGAASGPSLPAKKPSRSTGGTAPRRRGNAGLAPRHELFAHKFKTEARRLPRPERAHRSSRAQSPRLGCCDAGDFGQRRCLARFGAV